MLDSEQTATVKSPPAPMIEMRIRTPLPRAGCLFLLVTFCLLCSGPGLVSMGAELSFREKTERRYREAKADYRKKSNSEKVAVRFGEACFDWADFAENDSQRAGLAEEGIAAMRELLRPVYVRDVPVYQWFALVTFACLKQQRITISTHRPGIQ